VPIGADVMRVTSGYEQLPIISVIPESTRLYLTRINLKCLRLYI
jgi:hypothetical protein